MSINTYLVDFPSRMKDYVLLAVFLLDLNSAKIGLLSAYIGKSPAYKELVSAYREVHPGIRQMLPCV